MKIKILAASFFLLLPLAAIASPAPASSHAQAAEELFQTMNMEAMIGQSIDAVVKAQSAQSPELAKVQDVFRQFLGKYMGWQAIKAQMVAIYTDTFTEKELREINAFYQTPTGQKAVTAMPELLQKGMEIGQKTVQAHMGELQEAIQKKLKESGR